MAMDKTGAAYLAASFLTTHNVVSVSTDYLAWIDDQVTEATAILALLASANESKNPDRVMAEADAFYAAIEADPPTITSITPATGTTAGGTAVSIVGTNLLGATAVTFGATTATSIVITDTLITCVTPAKTAGAKDVVVTTPAGTVTSTGGFTYA